MNVKGISNFLILINRSCAVMVLIKWFLPCNPNQYQGSSYKNDCYFLSISEAIIRNIDKNNSSQFKPYFLYISSSYEYNILINININSNL